MEETIKRLSEELNLPQDVIIKSYKAYWMFIRHTIGKLPLKEDMDEETFSRLRPNFNIPNLGKLVCTYERYSRLKKKHRLTEKEHAQHKENKANG